MFVFRTMFRRVGFLVRGCVDEALESAVCSAHALRRFHDSAREDASSSASTSKFAHGELAQHYSNIPVIYASDRSVTGLPSGTWASRKLRKLGFVTGALDSQPFNQADRPLIYPNNEISTFFRRWGARFRNQICHLEIIPLEELQLLLQPDAGRTALYEGGWVPTRLESFQVLPRRVQVRAVDRKLLNVTLMHCPDDRIVHCQVPVRCINEDEAAYFKRGGWSVVTQKFVTVRSAATNIPLEAVVDCSKLESGARVRVQDLNFADGQHVVGLRGDVTVVITEGGKAPVVA